MDEPGKGVPLWSPSDHPPSVADILDNQLETSAKVEIGRVADIEVEWSDDGQLVLTNLVTGPQALAARVSSRLRPIFRFFLRDRFEHRIGATDSIRSAPR